MENKGPGTDYRATPTADFSASCGCQPEELGKYNFTAISRVASESVLVDMDNVNKTSINSESASSQYSVRTSQDYVMAEDKDAIINELNRQIGQLLSTVNALTEQISEQSKTINLLTARLDARAMLENDTASSSSESVVSTNSQQVKRRRRNKNRRANEPEVKKPNTKNRFEMLQVEELAEPMQCEKSDESFKTKQTMKNQTATKTTTTTTNNDKKQPANEASKKPENNPGILVNTVKQTVIKNTEEKSVKDSNATISEKSERIPPIVIRDKEKWLQISSQLKTEKINVLKAQTIKEGIRLHISDVISYRQAIKTLDKYQHEYHTWQLPSERNLHVVLRGIPEPVEEDYIKEELEALEYHPVNVIRMRRRDNTPLPLMLVIIPKKENSIYNLNHIANVVIKVESQHQKATIGQCHNCQRFGHAQNNCKAKSRCVYCGGAHHTRDCNKDQEAKKCCNCGEVHTASYKGCKEWPKLKARTMPSAERKQNISYVDALKKGTKPTAKPTAPEKAPTPPTMTDLFANFQAMYQQMQVIALQLGKMFDPSKH